MDTNFTPVELHESGNFEIGTVRWNDFVIGMMKSKSAPPGAVFLPAKVLKDGQQLWSFKRDHPGYRGLAKLEMWEEELVIVLCTKRELHTVIPIVDLHHHVGQTPDGDFIGGRGVKALIPMKETLAQLLAVEPVWSKREAAMREALFKKQQDEGRAREAAERREAEERREAARKERDEKRTLITSRKRLYVYTTSGDRRHGVPIVGDEWQILPADVFCILVNQFDQDTGVHGAVRECFITKKAHGGKIVRDRVTPVFEQNPRETQKHCALVTTIVPVKGELEEVLVVPDMDTVRKLNENGLNSGTLVMVKREGDPMHTVYRLQNGVIETFTHVKQAS